MTAEGPEAPGKKGVPNWVFVVAFVLGAVLLTVLPLLQRKVLKAGPPLMTLPAFSLATADGGTLGSQELRGKVYLASFVAEPCDEPCQLRQQSFGSSLQHVADTDGGVLLVSFCEGAPEASRPGWYVLGGPGVEPVLEAFRQGWPLHTLQVGGVATDAGQTVAEFARLDGFAVVDQNGALRGFWKDDVAGRGNAINAARLLWRYGPQP